MNRNLQKFIKIAAVIFIMLTGIYYFDVFLYKYTHEQIEHYKHRLFKDSYRKGLIAFFKFDELDIIDQVFQKKCSNYGTTLAEGFLNKGRFFNGDDQTYIDTQVYWKFLGSQYTITSWLKLDKIHSQSVIFLRKGKLGSGIMLYDGQMIFQVPSLIKPQICSYKFERYGEFVHIAATVDLKNNQACLYENGELKSAIKIDKVEHSLHPIQFGKYRPQKVYYPMKGIIDETSFWTKSLTQKEILKIFNSKKTFWSQVSYKYFLKLKLFENLGKLFQSISIALDILNPFYHENNILQSDLPVFDLLLSKSDLKYLNRSHNLSQQQGFFNWDQGDGKKGKLLLQNKEIPVRFKYYGNSGTYWTKYKKSFYIETLSKDLNHDMKRILFKPPEINNFLKPVLWKRLKNRYESTNIKNGFAVLRINSKFQGIYYFEEYLPDMESKFNENMTMEDILNSFDYPKDEVLNEYKQLQKKYLPLFLHDKTFSVSKKEMRFLIEKHYQKIISFYQKHHQTNTGLLKKTDKLVILSSILGDNIAGDYILHNLNLNMFKLPNVKIDWHSSKPEFITHTGRVKRPNSKKNEKVSLTCQISVNNQQLTKVFNLLVIGKQQLLPVLKISVPSGKIVNTHKVPACVELFMSDDFKTKSPLLASIKLRGNTALFYDKKSYSVKTEVNHEFFDFKNSNRFNLMGVAPDQTLMHNKLTYDLFRSFAKGDATHHAPNIHWVDLFINEEYKGIYEISEKVDIFSLGLNSFDKQKESHSLIYKAVGSQANFKIPLKHSYIQKFPKEKALQNWQPFMNLINFFGKSSTEDFIQKVENKIDLLNIIDFQILLNLTYNKDGVKHNLFICRNSNRNDKFFLIPWDYDKSFGLETDLWLSNHLFERLRQELPGFKKRFFQRWMQLRKEQLSSSSLLERIDDMEKTLKRRAPYNFEKYKISGYKNHHAKYVQELKSWLIKRLAAMDHLIEKKFQTE